MRGSNPVAPQNTRSAHLLTRATESRCACCPPERVCAWACVQGTGIADIVVGAVLEQSQSWALESGDPDQDAVRRALLETFNS